ncbi:hypothetical protein Godav_024208 [Gossypium davidsonii]|uniref:Uncharacterized protein n=1 Tax=Gossypium davidsonii TaxID=34287 RepID=A0A7J8SVW4_GOSDV|nr:hypothetical protein [Gossypium davidsonii]
MFQQKVPLVIEFSLCVVLKWLLDRSYRPWMLRSLCIGIDCGINQLLRVQFIIILRQANCMDNALAKTGIVKGRPHQKRNRKLPGGTVRQFDNNDPLYSSLLAGWLAEERRVPSGRLYRVKPLMV